MANFHLKEEYVPVISRISVSLADSFCSLLGTLVTGGALTYYFTRCKGLDTNLASLAWLIFGIWNSVNDPIFGFISDRTKSSLGRRIPYIRYGSPVFILSFIAFWIDWPGTHINQTAMFLQMLFFLFVFDTFYTAISTSIYIMPYEMAVSNKARSSIFIWKIIFLAIPMLFPMIAIPSLQPGPGESNTFYKIFMTSIGIISGLIIFFSTFLYKEKQANQENEQPGFIAGIKECFRNKAFLIFETVSFTIIYAQTALMQGVPYYLEEIKLNAVPLFTALGFGITAGIILFINKRETWGIKTSMRNMCILFAAGCFLMILLGENIIFGTISFFFFGIGFAGGLYLIPLMMGDTIDFDQHKTGKRREGMYAGVNSLVTKPAVSIAQSVFLWTASAFGYKTSITKGLQPASAKLGILLGWTLVTGILLVISFIALKYYPLHGENWNDIKEGLANNINSLDPNHF